MTPSKHAPGTYVALYGSHGEAWRHRCKTVLDHASVPWHDPTDTRWNGITFENGDRHQVLIDEIVAEEHEGLLDAGCVIFHLAGGPDPPASLAARFELGLLAGSGIRTFLHVDEAVAGRNYLWAATKLRPHLVSCRSLSEATEAAVQWMVEV